MLRSGLDAFVKLFWKGFISELEERSLFSAFAGEFSTEIEEEETPLGQLDAIYDEKDVSKSTIVTAKTTEEEIQRLESIEEDTTLGDSTHLRQHAVKSG